MKVWIFALLLLLGSVVRAQETEPDEGDGEEGSGDRKYL